MKQWIWVGLISIGLLGFAFVQMRLLWIGVRLEMTQFQQQVERATRQAQDDLFDQAELETLLSEWIGGRPFSNPMEIRDSLTNALQSLLKQHLEGQAVNAAFQFAISSPITQEIKLKSRNFDPQSFRFNEFSFYLGNEVQRKSGCECYLYLHINQLFSYLLSQLNYLLIPMILFFLALIVGVFFLVQNARKLQKLDAIKNDFINNLTHELKTPVFSIRLATNLLEQQPKEVATYAALIRKENNKLQTHIDKVLELASLETGKYHLHKERIDVLFLIKEIIESFELKLKEKQGKIITTFQPDSFFLEVDRLHFGNAIQALIDNAIKYNPSKPLIKIEMQKSDNQFIIKIKDNGIGIPNDQQRLIFQKFHRVQNGDQHEVKGFGLGLNYVQQVIQLHGGKISVESREQEGSTFIIKLKRV